MTDLDRLPLIEEMAALFPNEWVAFIISSEEDDDPMPTHDGRAEDLEGEGGYAAARRQASPTW